MSAFLEVYGTGDDTLADRLRAVARSTVLLDVVKELHEQARAALRDSVDELAEVTGTAGNHRVDGVAATLTDPQPKPRVADSEAFAGWFADAYPDDVETVNRVKVVDHQAAWDALQDLDLGTDERAVNKLFHALEPVRETVLPEKALDLAYDRGRLHVTDDGVIDVDTGEWVPGLSVSRAKPTLQVRLEKAARAAAKRLVRDALGVPSEVEA